jgi:serine/threonine protein phosphatase PrpC
MYPTGVTCATARGPRPYQQDRFSAVQVSNPDGLLLVVADGHRSGGEFVAQKCIDLLPKLLSAQTGEMQDRISNAVFELCRMTADLDAGSTVSAVHIVDNVAHVAFLGDSPVIIRRKDGKVVVSDEHNVRTNKKERDEAMERGGTFDGIYICKGMKGLQVARALGNADLGQIIRREPEYYAVELGPESVIIVCSDGLLDPAHGDTGPLVDCAVGMVVEEGADAPYLLAWAESRRLQDNATVVVYRHSV